MGVVMNPTLPDECPDDTLAQLQLRIARRADEIARDQSSTDSSHCWRLAETEVLSRESPELLKHAVP